MRNFIQTIVALLAAAQLVATAPHVKRNGTVGTCTSKAQRKAWHNLSDAEKQEYITAELCLMSSPPKIGIEGAKNRWDELGYVHVVQSNAIHDVGGFLPWHRLYMRAHEYLLQTECNYTGSQPYWEEVLDVNALNQSVVFDPVTGFGGNGGSDGCVADGPFRNLTLHISQASNYDNYCLSRDFTPDEFLAANQTNIDECFASANYSEAWQCYKTSLHTAGHLGVGGTMEDAAGSPGDPLFFLHHTNLDRLWWLWQSADLSTRLTDMNGRNVPRLSSLQSNNWTYPSAAVLEYDGDPGNETTLNHNLWMVGLIPNATVEDVMDLGGDLICAEYV